MSERPINIDYSKKEVPDELTDLFVLGSAEAIKELSEIGIGVIRQSIRKRALGEWGISERVGYIDTKTEAAKILASGDTTYKDSRLLEFSNCIMEEVDSVNRTSRGHRRSQKVLDTVATDLDIDNQHLRQLLRISRSEMIFEIKRWQYHKTLSSETIQTQSINLPDTIDLDHTIDQMAEPFREFLRVNEALSPSLKRGDYHEHMPKSDSLDPVEVILKTYEAAYNSNSRSLIGVLVAYETEAFATFYQHKLETNSTSAFDIYAIDRFIRSRRIDGENHLFRFASVLEKKVTNIPVAHGKKENTDSTILNRWIDLLIGGYAHDIDEVSEKELAIA